MNKENTSKYNTRFMQDIREILGLTRKEMANLMQVNHDITYKNIFSYETFNPKNISIPQLHVFLRLLLSIKDDEIFKKITSKKFLNHIYLNLIYSKNLKRDNKQI